MRVSRSKNGFTLIELLVVIAIIALLAAFVVANFAGVRQRGRDIQRKNDLAQVKKGLRLYYNDFQAYPTATSGQITGCESDGTTVCPWGSAFQAAATVYMNQLPQDPLNTGDFVYQYVYVNADQFLLFAQLENASDNDTTQSFSRCGVDTEEASTGMNYVVCSD